MNDGAELIPKPAGGAGRVARLATEVLGPPTVWAVRLSVSYLLVPYACAWWGVWVLHAVTLASLGVVAAIGVLAWRDWRGGTGSDDENGRTFFLATVGLLSSALFFAVIVAEGLANVFISPCAQAGTPVP